jgi:hypothetical protein
VIIAVVAMRVVQVTVDMVVDMVAVRHRLVAAGGAVHMTRLMAAAAMLRSAARGIGAAHLDGVLVDMVAMRVMEMPVMQIVDMVAMANSGVPATGVMLVRMVLVGRVTFRGQFDLLEKDCL